MKLALLLCFLTFGNWMIVVGNNPKIETNKTASKAITHSSIFDFHTVDVTQSYLVDFPRELFPPFSLCECVLVSSKQTAAFKREVLDENSTNLINCTPNTISKCYLICRMHAVVNREHIPKVVCLVMGHGEHSIASIYARICNSTIRTGLSTHDKTCCNKFNRIPCAN